MMSRRRSEWKILKKFHYAPTLNGSHSSEWSSSDSEESPGISPIFQQQQQHESFGLKTSLLVSQHKRWSSSLTLSSIFTDFQLLFFLRLGWKHCAEIECWEFSVCVAPPWLLTSILFRFSCVVCRLSSTFQSSTQSLQINFHSCHSSWRVMMREQRMCQSLWLSWLEMKSHEIYVRKRKYRV